MDQVKVVDKSYLERKYHPIVHKASIDAIVNQFMLNKEQERAFRIVANHASNPYSEQLKMYIGGMGGTGKTQVLKALSEIFRVIHKSKSFVVVAPTGTAAALLGGSTYHYLFGFSDRPDDKITPQQLLQLRARFEDVRYIFLDEVSMLSCHDMYRISVRLSKILNVADMPFGGMNILFAGDFAQLPPAIGQEHASLYSRTVGARSNSVRDQESALGKALWQQVTTVVILRQNMRQKNQSNDDAALRQALTNMRYKSCTPDDIAFLRTRISSSLPDHPAVTQVKFRNVSIITALNVHKDEINRLGSIRYAKETSQELVDFFSEDSVGTGTDEKGNKQRQQKSKNNCATTLTSQLQEILWHQPPSSNDKCIPGKLSLCIGMPVIIRSNSATELCITRGQEAVIHAWQTSSGTKGQKMLDTLFVELQNPPKAIQFDGLPLNVVPLTRSSVHIKVSLPNDDYIYISRSQVEVLPNFAMTDYSSQGKTRPYNPVDLNNCRTHQSYYTAISRSASAAGTCILQGFDSRMITGGASGALRQEFRELEILDIITFMTYESKLPLNVFGDQRQSLIFTFRQWKGEHYVPPHIHHALRWGKKDPFPMNEIKESISTLGTHTDQIKNTRTTSSASDKKSKSTIKVLTSVVTSTLSKIKRKLDMREDLDCRTSVPQAKRVKSCHKGVSINTTVNLALMPVGTIWSENSCAYDAIIVILHSIWYEHREIISERLNHLHNEYLSHLLLEFTKHNNGNTSLEAIRDDLRHKLCQDKPNQFTWGEYVGVDCVFHNLLQSQDPLISSYRHCSNNLRHRPQRRPIQIHNCQISAMPGSTGSTQHCMAHFQTQSAASCPTCGHNLARTYRYQAIPPLLALEVTSAPAINPELVVQIRIKGVDCQYNLRGIIYFGAGHYVSRFVSTDHHVWYHDGIETGRNMINDGMLNNCDLRSCRDKLPATYIYVLE